MTQQGIPVVHDGEDVNFNTKNKERHITLRCIELIKKAIVGESV